MAGTDYRISLEGMESLTALLREDEWYGKPVKRALARLGAQARSAARAAAPRDTGRLAASITYKVNTRKKQPRFVAIATRAMRTEGAHSPFAYPRILEFAPRFTRAYGRRVKSPPPNPRKGWFAAAIKGVTANLTSYLADATREIEQEFSRARSLAGAALQGKL